jgi:hypothetical protein
MGKNKMIAVTVIASGRHNKALLEQPLAVNTLRIVGQDVSFRDVINPGYRRPFSMTFSAKNRNVHLVCSGLDIVGGQYIMLTVTFIAGRRVWGPSS